MAAAGCVMLLGLWIPFAAECLEVTSPPELSRNWERFLSERSERPLARRFPFAECFESSAREHDLPEALLLAVARGESDFDPQARSQAEALGLMQIRWPLTARHLGVENRNLLFNPCTNIDAGARYLRELLDRYDGDLHLALAAYNYGPGRIPVDGSRLPKGAEWYSGYIYRHLAYVLGEGANNVAAGTDYVDEGQWPVIRFSRPYRARALAQALSQRYPDLRIDWFRQPGTGYRVVLLYADPGELDRGRRLLGEAGLTATREVQP
jgi:hypothetical protein